jgi:hypothetical protein
MHRSLRCRRSAVVRGCDGTTAAAQAQGQAAAPTTWTGPTMPDGQPDIAGVWDAVVFGSYSLTHPISGNEAFKLAVGGKIETKNPSRIVDPPDGIVPYHPRAAALQKKQQLDAEYPTRPEHIDRRTAASSAASRVPCTPPGPCSCSRADSSS